MIVDCISDLHGSYPKMEGGDLLIVAGDWTKRDTEKECFAFFNWVHEQNYRKKIIIAGNHDNLAQKEAYSGPQGVMKGAFDYLCDSGTEFEGLRIWGSPWTTRFEGMNPKCMAFTVDDDYELSRKWAEIPDFTDILVTHSPAWGMFDGWCADQHYGSRSLLHWIARHLPILKLHVHGHIHEGYGKYDIRDLQKQLGDPPCPVYVNASHMTIDYRPENKPIRVIL
jgi:Icc-related predicted phosphoesterase